MAGSRTTEQIRADAIEGMGESLGSVYHRLWLQLTLAHFKWDEYEQLFGESTSRVDLLNRAAPHSFRIIQDSLWESIVLEIARMTDPPESRGRGNLTIQRLIQLVDEQTRDELTEKIRDVIDASSFCRQWRNRRFAHLDLDLTLDVPAEPLARADLASIRRVFTALDAVLNLVSLRYLRSTTAFTAGASGHGAEKLLEVVRDGVEAKEARMARIREGTAPPEDYEWRPV